MMNEMKMHRYDYAVLIALAVLTAAVYGQVLNHDFIQYDDTGYVTENPIVRGGLSWKGFLWAFTTVSMANWHPLTWLSHMLDVELFGLKPGLHHLVSVLFHVLNTTLLFLVLRQMTGALWRSALVASLFALHPLHVESVAWVAERKDVISTLFWLLTLWAYTRYTKDPGLPRYWPVLLFFALGLLAKPMLVTLPLVLLLMDYWPLGRLRWQRASPAAPLTSSATPEKQGKKQKKRLREQTKPPLSKDSGKWRVVLPLVYEKIPLFALSAASSMITVYAQQKGGAVAPMALFSLPERVATAITAYVAYLWKMLWPFGLSIFYPLEVKSPVVVAACASLLLALTFAAVRWAGRRPYFLVGWLWYLLTLLPVIGILKVGDAAMADRYTYVALMGPFVALAWGSFDFSRALRIPTAALGATSALLIAALTLMTYIHLGYWRDTVSVFSHALDVNRSNHVAHYSLAVEYIHQKNYEEASSHLKSALQIHPYYAQAYQSLGIVCKHLGKNDEAIENLKKALNVNANLPLAHEWLGKIYLAKGQVDIAVKHYHRAIQDGRDNSVSYAGLGEALTFQNRLDEALRYTLQAIEGQPMNEKLYNNAGFILIRQGKFDEAIPRLQEALRLAPDYVKAHSNLGGALLLTGTSRIDEAIHHLREAVRLEPGNQSARENLNYALAQKAEVRKSGR